MAGFIFNFEGHGAFSPEGRVPEMSDAEIKAHNRNLADREWQSLIANGRGALYWTGGAEGFTLSTWEGSHSVKPHHSRRHWHACFGRRVERIDFWFTLAGANWHGVNIGDSQIVRVNRLKS